ncbi:S-layer homology domain-containing protein [Cohnella sp. JJ-181]|uniref:S-layer homology domain-containing protein n=1 Tax=Cohnella rhizoplanae TaxID=2974897 RepID=UPI00232E7DB8|nr:S-layer homology domain-containing protein [Cohnella sp. JJ-181]
MILTLCLAFVPAAAAYAAESAVVSLQDVADVQAGQKVDIKGNASLDEVIVKVLRPDSSIVYFDIVPVTAGQFAAPFTIGSGEPGGTYTVVVGQGKDVASKSFKVTAGTITPPPSGAILTQTPPPPPGKVITPVGGADPVLVDTSKNKISTTDVGGRQATVVSQDGVSLADALKKAAGQDNKGAAPVVYIAYEGKAGEAVQFNLPFSVLKDAASSGAIVSLQTGEGEYSLPLGVLDFDAIAASLGASASDISIQVNIVPSADDINAKIKQSAAGIGAAQAGGAIEFSIVASGGGKTVALNEFGPAYVSRTVVAPGTLDASHATVVLYDPQTGALTFVPAQFTKQSDGTVKITFKRNGNSIYAVLTASKAFSDLSTHWAKADVELLASKLVVNGVSDAKFAPNNNITRAEFAALLVRALGLTPDAPGAAGFKDIASGSWYAGAVGAAAKAKLVEGFEGGVFKPGDTITREQMAVMIARAVAYAQGSAAAASAEASLAGFKDQAAIGSWARASVAQAVDAGIITGMTSDTFAPSAKASRAQAAVMLKRFMQHADLID